MSQVLAHSYALKAVDVEFPSMPQSSPNRNWTQRVKLISTSGVVVRANLVQTGRRKRLPLVARTASARDVLSSTYRALLLRAAPFGGFKCRRPNQKTAGLTLPQ
jgi:hypothetical protein